MFIFTIVVALAVVPAFVSIVVTTSSANKGGRKGGIKTGQKIANDKPTKVRTGFVNSRMTIALTRSIRECCQEGFLSIRRYRQHIHRYQE